MLVYFKYAQGLTHEIDVKPEEIMKQFSKNWTTWRKEELT